MNDLHVAPFRIFLILAAFVTAATTGDGETLRVDADTAARRAVEASALVVAADARLAASESGVVAADALRLPVVESSAAVSQRSAVPELSVPIGGPGTPPQTIFPNIETTYLAQLAITQPLYTGGAIEAGRRAARHRLDAAGSAHRRSVLDLRYSARTNYWLAVAAEAGLDSALAEERRAQRLLDDASALRDAGMAVNADLLAAEARTAAAKVEVIRAETEFREAIARLRSLMGIAVGTEIELADAGTAAVPLPPADEGALESEATASRPELSELDARAAALEAQARSIDAGRRPLVAVSGAWDLARPNPRYLPLEDTWNDTWSVGVTASWKLFDGGRTRASATAVRSESEALLADRGEVERRVRLEVETARLTLAAALDAVAAADAARAAARAREEAARERYQAGIAQIWEMLDAQAELAEAERSQVRVRATAWIAAAALDRSVGR